MSPKRIVHDGTNTEEVMRFLDENVSFLSLTTSPVTQEDIDNGYTE